MKKQVLLLLFILLSPVFTIDQKVFAVDYENQAGWKNKSKMHLMY